MRAAEKIRLAFVGGHTRRWHCNDFVGEERVDSHTWGMLSILLVLHPEPPLRLIKAVQFHDAGEMFSGDIPHPAKVAVPGLGEGDKEVARRWSAATSLGSTSYLDPDEQWWLRFTDMAQAYLTSCRQLAQGNSLMADVKLHIEYLIDNWDCNMEYQEEAIAAVLEAGRLVNRPTTRSIIELEEQNA